MAYAIEHDFTTSAESTIMFSEDIVTTQANTNIGNGYIYGFLSEGWRIAKPLSAIAQFTYAAAENSTTGPLPSILPIMVVDLRYTKNNFSLVFRQRFM